MPDLEPFVITARPEEEIEEERAARERAEREALAQLADVTPELQRIEVPRPEVSQPRAADISPYPPGREPRRPAPRRDYDTPEPLDAGTRSEIESSGITEALARRLGDQLRANPPRPVAPAQAGARPQYDIHGERRGWAYAPHPDGSPPPPIDPASVPESLPRPAPPRPQPQPSAQLSSVDSSGPPEASAALPQTSGTRTPVLPTSGPTGPQVSMAPASGIRPPAGEQPEPAAAPKSQRDELMEMLRARLMAQANRPEPEPVDHTGADWADALRRVFRALGASMGARTGEFRSYGDLSRQREREAQQARAQQDQRWTQDAMLVRRMEGEDADRASRSASERLRRTLEERRFGLEQQRADAYSSSMGSLDAQREAATDRLRTDAEREEALDNPQSDLSRIARASLHSALASYPDAARQRFVRNLEAQNLDLDQLSARAVYEAMPEIGKGFRDLLARQQGRRGGGGGLPVGSGGVMRSQWGTDADPVYNAMVEQGIDPRVARASAMDPRERREALGSLRSHGLQNDGSGNDSAADEIVPGVRPTLGSVGSVEAREMRDGIAEARAHAAALGTIDDAARRYGAQSVIDPRIEAELVAPIQAMMAMVSALRNTGVINPQEAPTIEAAIPNPQNLRQMTLGEVQTRVRSFRTLLEQQVSSRLATRGVDDAGQQRVIQFLRTGRFAGQPEAPAQSAVAPRARFRVPGIAQPVQAPAGMSEAEALRQLRERYGTGVEPITGGP